MAGSIIGTDEAVRGFPQAFTLRLGEDITGRLFRAECRDSPDRTATLIDTLQTNVTDAVEGVIVFNFNDTSLAPDDGYVDVIETNDAGDLLDAVFDGDFIRFQFVGNVTGPAA